jgi:predicted nuclease with TOPRIM domain
MPDETSPAQYPQQQEPQGPSPQQQGPSPQQQGPTPEQPEPTPKPQKDCSSFPPPGECGGVDDLSAVAAGDKAKTDYNDTVATELATARTDYEATRKAYRTARHDVKKDVEDLRNQLKNLVERIGCQISKRNRKCLKDAFDDVLEQLKCCRDEESCCDKVCKFPLPADIDKLPTLPVEELSALITKYEAAITEAKDCFDKLKKEPEALQTRVANLKTKLEEINNMLTGDAAALDLNKAYAEALVAQWKIANIWGIFKQVQQFVDCLCHALTCWTDGVHAVYILKGAEAIAKYNQTAKQKYCEKLRKETVDQVLAGYDKRCAKKEPDDKPDDYDDYDDDDDDDPDDDDDDDHDDDDHDYDCGCHHHHSHRKQHDHDAKGKY